MGQYLVFIAFLCLCVAAKPPSPNDFHMWTTCGVVRGGSGTDEVTREKLRNGRLQSNTR